MRRFAVLGDPVAHSLSPAMHATAFAALDLEATYEARRIPADRPAELTSVMRRLAAAGGGGNVTLPHKGTAAGALDEASERVRRTGACNCFWGRPGGVLAGDNTDVVGIVGALDALVGRAPGDVVVLGAGGAAAAALDAAIEVGATGVRVANRTGRRARELAERFADRACPVRTMAWPPSGSCDVVVNATSLGLDVADPLPSSFDRLDAGAALDLVYTRTGGTAWTAAACEHGVPCLDGREVLVRQAAACYPHWFGVPGPSADLRRGLGGA